MADGWGLIKPEVEARCFWLSCDDTSPLKTMLWVQDTTRGQVGSLPPPFLLQRPPRSPATTRNPKSGPHFERLLLEEVKSHGGGRCHGALTTESVAISRRCPQRFPLEACNGAAPLVWGLGMEAFAGSKFPEFEMSSCCWAGGSNQQLKVPPPQHCGRAGLPSPTLPQSPPPSLLWRSLPSQGLKTRHGAPAKIPAGTAGQGCVWLQRPLTFSLFKRLEGLGDEGVSGVTVRSAG